MAKINIAEKSHEIKGTLKKGNVKPIGNSAHIPFSKEHTGKIVDIIIPDEPFYTWVFSENLRSKIIKLAKESVSKSSDQLSHYYLGCIDNFSNSAFDLDDLVKVLSLLEDDKSLKNDISKIKKAYHIL